MGTPAFAVPALGAVAAGCDVRAVVTRPDRPRGRGRESAASDVAIAAGALGLEVLKPADLRAEETRHGLAALGADLFVVVAFGAILTPALLATPRLGCINLHGSLLPDYRGASPVQRALWDGRAFSGVTTLWMDEGVDTGDLILQRWHAIGADESAGTLAATLAELGAPLLAESIRLAAAGEAPRRAQDRTAGSYAAKLRKEDGVVDWSLDAVTVWNRQRAVTPWPGATAQHEGRGLLLLATRPHDLLRRPERPGTVLEIGPREMLVACGRGALALVEVRPEGRAAMSAASFARGARLAPGDALGVPREAHA